MTRFWSAMAAFLLAGPALSAPAPDLDRFLSYSFVSAIAAPDSGGYAGDKAGQRNASVVLSVAE